MEVHYAEPALGCSIGTRFISNSLSARARG
jgi:hypothetical protein